ncbi:MAG: anti-sigma factor [Ornithinimicrobium sp.]
MTAFEPHVDDLVGAFALDAVTATERRQVEDHLAHCERCRDQLRDHAEAAVHLSEGLDLAPPASLRASVLEAVAQEPQRPADQPDEPEPVVGTHRSGSEPSSARRGPAAIWGLAAAGLIAVGGWGIWQNLDEDLSPTEQVIQADDAERFQTQYEGNPVTVVASAELDRAVLVTDELPGLADGEVYQGWWIDDAGTITSAGVLDDAAGASDRETELRGDPGAESAFALSVEPTGGSEQPTTEPVVVLPLEG